jgi:PPK2 family polyphosphate:nucleotide phosphotransferase
MLQVAPGSRADLSTIDTRSMPGFPTDRSVRRDPKVWAQTALAELGADLAGFQERLYAQAKTGRSHTRLLLILQAMDCGGKDGIIRRVAGTMNPAGLHIVSFGPPTQQELAHDFLWRIAKALPAPGMVGVFNRSQYEDVLIARVHRLVPARTWQSRYKKINEFERNLAETGTALLKVMLHISPEEQKRRLAARLADPTKYWKFNPDDLDERARWAEYQQAYEDALTQCSTAVAPWYVVPADHKWYRDWAVAHLLRETFVELNPSYPEPSFNVAEQRTRLDRADPGAGRHPDRKVTP